MFDEKFGYLTREKQLKKNLSKDTNYLALGLVFFLLTNIVSGFVLAFLQGIMMAVTGEDFVLSNNFTYMVSSGMSFVGIVVPYLFYVKVNKINLSYMLDFKKVNYTAPLYIIGAIGLVLAINIPNNTVIYFLQEMGIKLAEQETLMPSNATEVVVMFFYMCIVAPVFEEFAFRGIICRKLRKYGDLTAILVSSVLFSAAHMNLTVFVVTFLMGCVLAYIYIKTKNLWVSIIIHTINNALSLTFALISEFAKDPAQVEIIIAIVFYGVIAVGITCLAVVLIAQRKNLKLSNPYVYVSSFKKTVYALCNPSAIIFLIVSFVISVVAVVALY